VNARPGIDTPDHRGRTGLDRVGRDPDRNPDVVVSDVELTSQGWQVSRCSSRGSVQGTALAHIRW
jgi:hypothetical protein